jgi:hypothetical protein
VRQNPEAGTRLLSPRLALPLLAMRIYFNACCVNRLTDDQSQSRIQREAEAIERILRYIGEGTYLWLGSGALTDEIERSPQTARRRENQSLLGFASGSIEASAGLLDRARQLQAFGYGAFDAMHLASSDRTSQLTISSPPFSHAHKDCLIPGRRPHIPVLPAWREQPEQGGSFRPCRNRSARPHREVELASCSSRD